MKKYQTYKKSTIEGIHELPSHWGQYLIKRGIQLLTDYEANGSFASVKENVRFLEVEDKNRFAWYVRATDIENNHLSDYHKLRFVDESTYNFLHKTKLMGGELLVAKRGEIGKVYLMPIVTNFKATLAPNLYLVRLDKNKLLPKYSHYLFLSVYGQTILKNSNKSTTIGALYKDDFKALPFIFPPIIEQTAIANYLDHKTSQIDHLISKKEKFIKLLEEERVAVINQAVTKGLDPNVPMKDSGVEWLGEIPEHWEVWKISHAFSKIGSGTTPESGNPIYHENGTINWLNTGDLNDSFLYECSKKITSKAIEDYTSLKLFPNNSLVIAMYGATIGKTAFLEFETTTNQACCVFGKGEIIDLLFLQYWFKAKKEHIINLSVGGGQPNISQQILKDIRLGCPIINEQVKIVDFLQNKDIEFDKLKSKLLIEIELLKEYKTALISEVVTGKVDVSTSSTQV